MQKDLGREVLGLPDGDLPLTRAGIALGQRGGLSSATIRATTDSVGLVGCPWPPRGSARSRLLKAVTQHTPCVQSVTQPLARAGVWAMGVAWLWQ